MAQGALECIIELLLSNFVCNDFLNVTVPTAGLNTHPLARQTLARVKNFVCKLGRICNGYLDAYCFRITQILCSMAMLRDFRSVGGDDETILAALHPSFILTLKECDTSQPRRECYESIWLRNRQY